MRKILESPDEVIHFWANKVQPEGSTRTGHCYFGLNNGRGARPSGGKHSDYLWSYGTHYCIGRHLPGGTVAISSTNSTMTTNGQVRRAWQAVSHLSRLMVPSPQLSAREQRQAVEHEVTELLGKARRARIRKGEYASEARRMAQDFNIFANALGERGVRIPIEKFDEWEEHMAKAKARALASQRYRARAQVKAEAEGRQKWREGASSYWGAPVMLRLRPKESPEAVETSMGAYIPVVDALRLWPVIQGARSRARDYEVGMPLGEYRLTKIRRDGSIVVGCHDIAYAELKAIADQLGLVESPASSEREQTCEESSPS